MTTTPFSTSTPGAGTWTAPTTGTVLVQCSAADGGGGAGGALGYGGSGGGGGAYASSQVAVVANTVYSFSVGAAGAGGSTYSAAGGNGGDTTFQSTQIVAKGGQGGSGNGGAGGLGGQGSACTGDSKYSGGPGQVATGGSAGTPGGARGGPLPGAGGGSGGKNTNPPNGTAGGNGTVAISYVTDPTPGHFVVTATTAGTTSWTAPASGQITVQCMGDGGGGGGGNGLGFGGSGGGGGAYSAATVDVVEGTVYSLVVGPGGAAGPYGSGSGGNGSGTFFKNGSTVLVGADFGLGGTWNGGTPGAGGLAANCVGTTINAGAAGHSTTTSAGGNGGAGAVPFGGAGGAGGGSDTPDPGPAGYPGVAPGGGGGGGRFSTGGTGGAGAVGSVTLSYYFSYGYAIENNTQKFIVAISQIQGGVAKPLTPSRITSGAKLSVARATVDLTALLPPIPSYVPSASDALYSQVYGTFNWKLANTANLRAALAAAGSSPCHLAFFGDSVTEGWTSLSGTFPAYTVTADRLHAWPIMMRNYIMQQTGVPCGGTGFVRAHSIAGAYADERWNGSTTSGWQGNVQYISGANQTATFTSDQNGDSVAVMVLDTAGNVRVSVDGATSGQAGYQVFNGANTGNPTRYVISGLPSGTHVVSIQSDTGVAIQVTGCEVFDSAKGIRIHNPSQGGSTASGTGQAAWDDLSGGYTASLAKLYTDWLGCYGSKVAAAFILLGGNDLKSATPSQLITAYEAIAAAAATTGTDIIFGNIGQGSSLFADPSVYPPFWTAICNMVIANGWPLIDSQFIIGGYDNAKANGWTGDDYGHFSPKGALAFGTACGKALLQVPTS